MAGSERKKFNAATRLAGGRQKYRDREREGGNGTEVCAMQRRQTGLRETAGGRQKASRSRAAQCGFSIRIRKSYIIE